MERITGTLPKTKSEQQFPEIESCIVCNKAPKVWRRGARSSTRSKAKSKTTQKKGEARKSGLKVDIPKSWKPTRKSSKLFPQLRPIFLLKEVFRYPRDNAETAMETLGNPSNWFKICDSCCDVLDEAIEIKRQINKLEGCFHKLRKRLRNLVDSSASKAKAASVTDDVKPNLAMTAQDEYKLYFRTDVRNLVRTTCSSAAISTQDCQLVDEVMDIKEEDEMVIPSYAYEMHCDYHDDDYVDESETTGGWAPANNARITEGDGITSWNTFIMVEKEETKDVLQTSSKKDVQTAVDDDELELNVNVEDLNFRDPEFKVWTNVEPTGSCEQRRSTRLRMSRGNRFSEEKSASVDSDAESEINEDEILLRRRFLRMRMRTKLKKAKKLAAARPPPKVKEGNVSSHVVGRPRNPERISFIAEHGDKLLDMSIISYPPSHVEKLRIPQIGQNYINVKDYGEVTRPSDFPCPSCERFFVNRQYAIAHIHKMHFSIRQPFKCPKCSVVSARISRLKEHVKSHETGKLRACTTCNDFFCQSKTKMDKHIIQHQKKASPPTCDLCKEPFESFVTYAKHMIQTHGFVYSRLPRLNRLICELCSEEFGRELTLQFHKVTEHNQEDEEGKFPKCPSCEKIFMSEINLRDHVARVHEKAQNFFCDQCGKGFVVEESLKSHSARAHSTNPVPCNLCGFHFGDHLLLKKHIKGKHRETLKMTSDEIALYLQKLKENPPHKCKLCGKGFEFKYVMYHHYRNDHEQELAKFHCDICGKGFSRACSVKRHKEATHSTETTPCEYCKKEFSCTSSLNLHLRSHCAVKRKHDKLKETSSQNPPNLLNAQCSVSATNFAESTIIL